MNPIDVQKHLKGVDYPAAKQQLVQHAEKAGADNDLRTLLEKLPDKRFETPADVMQALGNVS
jgi:hypothetical protein